MYRQTTQNNGNWEEKWQKIQQKTPGYKSCKKIKNPKMNKNEFSMETKKQKMHLGLKKVTKRESAVNYTGKLNRCGKQKI